MWRTTDSRSPPSSPSEEMAKIEVVLRLLADLRPSHRRADGSQQGLGPRAGVGCKQRLVVQLAAERGQSIQGPLERNAVFHGHGPEVVDCNRDRVLREKTRASNRFHGLADEDRRGPEIQVFRGPRVMAKAAPLVRLLDQARTTPEIDRKADIQGVVHVAAAADDQAAAFRRCHDSSPALSIADRGRWRYVSGNSIRTENSVRDQLLILLYGGFWPAEADYTARGCD